MPPSIAPIKFSPPGELLTPCSSLPKLTDEVNLADLLQHELTLIQLYGECQLKLQTLQQWVIQEEK